MSNIKETGKILFIYFHILKQKRKAIKDKFTAFQFQHKTDFVCKLCPLNPRINESRNESLARRTFQGVEAG